MDTNPDPEVRERPTRRRFTASYKVAILDELDQATEPGSKGAIFRPRACIAATSVIGGGSAPPVGMEGERVGPDGLLRRRRFDEPL